jgi:hypothetical protein
MRPVKAKKETCLKCGATDLENLVRVEEGKPLKIYVRCSRCRAFVARYIVATYTSDMSYESLLKILRSSQLSCHDCRGSMRELEAFSRQVQEEFQRTEQQVEKKPENRLIVEILEEKKPHHTPPGTSGGKGPKPPDDEDAR